MVGIVLVCHSSKMVDEFLKFLDVFKTSDFEILNGVDPNQEFGTTKEYLMNVVRKADKKSGVLIFVDLGSSIDFAQQVKEALKGEIEVEIADAPVIEGSISAVAANDEMISLDELKKIAEDSNKFRKIKK